MDLDLERTILNLEGIIIGDAETSNFVLLGPVQDEPTELPEEIGESTAENSNDYGLFSDNGYRK